MKIILDTESKSAEAPYELKELMEGQQKFNKAFGKSKSANLSDVIDLTEYKITYKQNRTKVDKTNSKDINDFMENIKDTDKDLYKEFIALRDKEVSKTKSGKPIKTNFLIIKKWFYEHFPNNKPLRSA
jgi:hypothetical protein